MIGKILGWMLLCFVKFLILIAIWILKVFNAFFTHREPEKPTPCIHGHENWDDCPDCCH